MGLRTKRICEKKVRAMNEHTMAWITLRPDMGPKTTACHEVACSCGWSRKYVSYYRASVMFEKHVEAERIPDGTV
jgi:hypothetical protein